MSPLVYSSVCADVERFNWCFKGYIYDLNCFIYPYPALPAGSIFCPDPEADHMTGENRSKHYVIK